MNGSIVIITITGLGAAYIGLRKWFNSEAEKALMDNIADFKTAVTEVVLTQEQEIHDVESTPNNDS